VYEQALRRQNIPFITTGGSGYYERGEIRDMIALLGVVNNPFDDLYLVRVMRCGIFRIKNSVIARLAGFYEQDELDDEEKSPPVKRHTLYDALARAGELDMVEDEKKTLFRLRAFIDGFLARKNACSLSRLVYGVITESNYLHYCRSLEPNERTRRLANLKKFYSLVQEFEERNVFSSLADFIAYVKEIGQQEVVESEAKIAGGDAVRIMSIHQAKGLEFRAVFVANLRERSFPSGVSSGRAMVYEETKLISDGEGKKGESGKEELRLLYVAMTRAREKLIVSGSRNAKGEMSEFMKFFMDANGRLLPPFSRLIRDMSAVSLPDWTRSVLERGCDKPQPVPSIERIKAVLFAEPRRVKSSGVVPLHFSVSQIAAYDRCPLLYKYRYFLNLPPDPGIEDESSGKTVEESVFGTVMHMVLEEHMLCAKKKQKWGKEKMKEKFSVLAKAYGVNDAEISGLYEREASHVLSSFVEDERNNADNMASLEQPFSLFFDGHEVSGVIDRIDSAEGGYRIIDYKTGRKKTAEPYVLPMRIYRMGCEKVLGYKPVKKLSLYFVRYGEMAEIGLYEGMEKDTEERVKAIIKKIGGEDFPANAAQGSCDFCDYRLLCKK